MRRLFITAAVLAVVAAGPALSEPSGRPDAPARRQAPLSRVLSMIAQRFPGRQLNTTMGEAGGRPAYLIQWQMAKDGRIVMFAVDAETGQIIGQQGG